MTQYKVGLSSYKDKDIKTTSISANADGMEVNENCELVPGQSGMQGKSSTGGRKVAGSERPRLGASARRRRLSERGEAD